MSVEKPSPPAKKRSLEKIKTPGVYRRGKSYVVMYRHQGRQHTTGATGPWR